MITQYNIHPYTYGQNGFALNFSATNYNVTLAASTDTSFTVPGFAAAGVPSATTYNKFVAILAWTNTADVFWALNATAVLPSSAAFVAGTSSLLQLNNAARIVKTGDVIHVISSGTPNVSVQLYAIQE